MPVGGHDGETLPGQCAAEIVHTDEVQVLWLEPRAPPSAEQPSGSGLRVVDFDHEVAAGPESLARGGKFLPWHPGMFQVVVHAHHVVLARQVAGQADEGPLLGPGDAAVACGDLDAFTQSSPWNSVPGWILRASAQKRPWPVPTSSQREGRLNGSSARARAR